MTNPRRDPLPQTTLTPDNPQFPWPYEWTRKQYEMALLRPNNQAAADLDVRVCMRRAEYYWKRGEYQRLFSWVQLAATVCAIKDLEMWRMYEGLTWVHLFARLLNLPLTPEQVTAVGLDKVARHLPQLPREGYDDLSKYPAAVRQEWAFASATYEDLTRPKEKPGRKPGQRKTGGRPDISPEKASDSRWLGLLPWGQKWAPDLDPSNPVHLKRLRGRYQSAQQRGDILKKRQIRNTTSN